MYRITLKKKPTGEPVHFRPLLEPHWHSYLSMSYENGSHVSTAHLIPTRCRVFWLWWVLVVEVCPRKLSKGQKWHRAEDAKREAERQYAQGYEDAAKPRRPW